MCTAIKMKENIFLLFCILFISLSAGHKDGFVRLIGGQDNTEGRVEIFHNGVWGTVCDDDWDKHEAHVVCRQLHFPGAAEALASATFGEGTGNIWMDNLACTGVETNLFECPFRGWGVHDCKHGEDAGVRCQSGPEPVNKDLRHEFDLDHNANLSQQLGELFDSGRDCDLNITVMSNNNNNNNSSSNNHNNTVETICAHSVILSLNSILNTSQPDFTNLSIDASFDCSQHAKNFVRYFYTRKIKLTRSSAQCILKMAFNWGVTELQNEAANLFRQFLPEDPTFETQISFYEYAVQTGDEALQEVCLRYLAWNCEALIYSPAWANLPSGLVKALLSCSDIVVQNETVILNGLQRWAAAQGNKTVPEILLKLIHFPMIPAEDLYTLDGSQYYASKLQGFQFNALPFTTLLSDMREKQNIYTSRIYTGAPWSITISYHDVKAYKDLGFHSFQGQRFDCLTSHFQTPVHNSACFAFHNMHWKASVYISEADCSRQSVACPSLPAVSLKVEEKNKELPDDMKQRILYSNRLVVMCEGRFVFHVNEFNAEDLVFLPSSAEQVYPCHSKLLTYQVVVRPQYSTD